MAFDKDVENRTHPRAWVGGPRSTSMWLNSLGMWISSMMLVSVNWEAMSSLMIADDPFKRASVSPEPQDVPSGLSLCACWAAGNWSCKNTTEHKCINAINKGISIFFVLELFREFRNRPSTPNRIVFVPQLSKPDSFRPSCRFGRF